MIFLKSIFLLLLIRLRCPSPCHVHVQFEGRRTYGRVAQGGTGPTKVKQVHVLEETAHAKSVGDGLASEIKNEVASTVKGGYVPLPGTRNHVLLLAGPAASKTER